MSLIKAAAEAAGSKVLAGEQMQAALMSANRAMAAAAEAAVCSIIAPMRPNLKGLAEEALRAMALRQGAAACLALVLQQAEQVVLMEEEEAAEPALKVELETMGIAAGRLELEEVLGKILPQQQAMMEVLAATVALVRLEEEEAAAELADGQISLALLTEQETLAEGGVEDMAAAAEAAADLQHCPSQKPKEFPAAMEAMGELGAAAEAPRQDLAAMEGMEAEGEEELEIALAATADLEAAAAVVAVLSLDRPLHRQACLAVEAAA